MSTGPGSSGVRTETQGTRAWFEMLGSLLVETAAGLTLPDVSFLERYADGGDLGDGRRQGIVLRIVDGRAEHQVGVAEEDEADVEITVTVEAARSLNLVRSADPAYAAMREAYAASGALRVQGDPTPLEPLFDLVHDPVVARTR